MNATLWINKINNEKIIDFKRLEGGVSSEVYKVKTKKNFYCLKRSLSKLLVEKEWFADTKRLKYEYYWLIHCKKIIPRSIPKVFQFSSKNDFLILEYLDEKKYNTLKSKLLKKIVNLKIIKKISKDIYKIHNESSNSKTKKKFDENFKNFYDLRLDAYFNEVGRVYPNLKIKIKNIIRSYRENSSTLVHGDFSPKNILVYKNNVKYIDAETCNYGDPVFDVVFFLNHLLIKSIHMPQMKKKILEAYKIFFDTYIKLIKKNQREGFINRYLEMMPIMLLARVDGKSPVEYIKKKIVKNKIKLLSFTLMDKKLKTIEQIIKIVNE